MSRMSQSKRKARKILESSMCKGFFPSHFGEVGRGGGERASQGINLKLNQRHIPPTIIAREDRTCQK